MENNKAESAQQKQTISPPSVTLPKGGGAIRGMGEKFAANPVTGTGSMSIPIATSPGRSGFGPQLSLSYDSGSGNGPFGFGWSLSIPSITRKTDKGLPQYRDVEESDVFILSGTEDLVPVLNDDGSRIEDSTTVPGYTIYRYRPRIEGLFARIERWTDQVTGEIHWRSISRENMTTIYGRDNKSRIFDPVDLNPTDSADLTTAHSTRIFSWLICQSYDDMGNAIIYEYESENSSGIDLSQAHEANRTEKSRSTNRYLKRIKYGNSKPNRNDKWEATDPTQLTDWMFEVVFDYLSNEIAQVVDGQHYKQLAPDANGQIFIDNPSTKELRAWGVRQDPFSTYRAGYEVRTYRLCRCALMFHHFPQELGVADYLVRSTEFSYTDTEGRVASFITSVTQSGYVLQKTPPNRYLKKSLPPVKFEYSRVPSSDELAQSPIRDVETESLENLPIGLDGSSYQWMDLDGEGIYGILTEQADGWFYKRNLSANNLVYENGPERAVAKFGATEVLASKPASGLAGGAQFLDLAGDGQVDLVQMDGPVRGFYERTGNERWESFQSFKSWPNLNSHDPNLKFVDLTGDGHADILVTEGEALTWHHSLAEDGFGPSVRVSLPLDEEKGPRLVFADGTQSIYLADLSGDGLSDLVRIRNGEVCYWPNLGYGRFSAKVTMDNSPCFDMVDQFDQRRIRLADTDGSGTTDILYLHREGVRIYFNQSGNSWSDPVALPQFPPIDNIASIQTLDLLGNGTACLVWSSSLPGNARQPMRYIALMEEKPHLMVGVKNNLGAETKVYYAPSTKFYLEDKKNGSPSITRLPFPVHVVERVETYDYIGQNRFVTRYTYHHGYFDGPEREFRGFGLVEQWDTEEIGNVILGLVAAKDNNWDKASFVPPVLTRTWFHTGAYIEVGHISKLFEHEYYREGDAGRGEDGLTDIQLEAIMLDDTVLPTKIRLGDGAQIPCVLSGEETREACRSLKGSILRQEIYALDKNPDGTPIEESDRPYTVSERNYTIELLQSQGKNRHAVFFTHARETVDFHYERKLFNINGSSRADPRATHNAILNVDNYGNVLQSVAIGYGRRLEGPDPVLSPEDREKQKLISIIYKENRFTNHIVDKADIYRTPLPAESCTYELQKPEQEKSSNGPTELYRFGALLILVSQAGDGNHDIAYEDIGFNKAKLAVTNDANEKDKYFRRLIEHIRTHYRPDDLGASRNNNPSALLPLRKVESMALPGESYKLAFTLDLLKTIYIDTDKLSTNDINNVFGTDGGYVHSEGDTNWWIPSGRVFYSPTTDDLPAVELAFARQHFYLPHRFRDPFGNETTLTYDSDSVDQTHNHNLLLVETRDALDNVITVRTQDDDGNVESRNDYRVLQPFWMTDPNGNRTQVVFDAMGMVVVTVVMGKPRENKGDIIDNAFQPDLDLAQIQAFAKDPHGNAQGLLMGATTRIVYDLDRYQRCKQPPFVSTLAREIHFNDTGGANAPIQIHFGYSDGYGREIQTKVQAEAGDAPQREADVDLGMGDVKPGDFVRDVKGDIAQVNSAQRYVGTGRTVYNNLGKPIKKYEPFFSSTHLYEPETDMTDTGVTPILFYDPVERVVATLHPNHTYEKVAFDPWQQTTWDVNDTVKFDPKTDANVSGFFTRLAETEYLPTWYDQCLASVDSAKHDAAQNTEAHSDTPTFAHFDSLGRTFLTIANNGKDAGGQNLLYKTRVNFDIEGNQREVRDERINLQGNPVQRIVMRYDYDMLGDRIHQNSMDAGERWMLNDVTGKPIRSWDSRGQEFIYRYDKLRRPIEMQVTGGDGQQPLDNVYEKIIYGEDQSLNGKKDTELNLRGKPFTHFDTAGKVQFEEYDFKGNLIRSNRRLALDYKNTPHWTVANPDSLLENYPFASKTEYDALNRITNSYTPDGSVTTLIYNPANLLEKVDVLLHDGSSNHFVMNINYNEKGQRQDIVYGNNITTTYEYERETFRLIHLETKQANGKLQDLHYTYDPVGNIVQIEDRARPTIFFNNFETKSVNDFKYDAVYRLIQAHGREHIAQVGFDARDNWRDQPFLKQYSVNDPMAWRNYTERYQYDSVGNIEQIRHEANGGSWTRDYTYENGNNRLKSTVVSDPVKHNYSYSHHPEHGFMTGMPHLEVMDWNFKDELQAVAQQKRVDGGMPETTYYVYDFNGQRIRKVTENDADPGAWPTPKHERIYISGTEVYKEYSGNHAGLERMTLHVMDDTRRIAMVETRNNVDDGSRAKLTRYQFSNHLGTACLETDDTARMISYEEYHPYGTTAYQAVDKDIKAAAKRYRYTGKERDEESGLYYHGARYYAPWLGRWTSCDPVGLDAGLNLYEYVKNSPTRHIDPNGKGPLDWVHEKMDQRHDFWEGQAQSSYAHGDYVRFALEKLERYTGDAIQFLIPTTEDVVVTQSMGPVGVFASPLWAMGRRTKNTAPARAVATFTGRQLRKIEGFLSGKAKVIEQKSLQVAEQKLVHKVKQSAEEVIMKNRRIGAAYEEMAEFSLRKAGIEFEPGKLRSLKDPQTGRIAKSAEGKSRKPDLLFKGVDESGNEVLSPLELKASATPSTMAKAGQQLKTEAEIIESGATFPYKDRMLPVVKGGGTGVASGGYWKWFPEREIN